MNKKITLISFSTPTFNNVRAASALPYHLIKGAKENKDIDFEIYSFNTNHIEAAGISKTEKELGVKIHLLKFPIFLTLILRFKLLFLRILMRYPLYTCLNIDKTTVKRITDSNPDLIWIYGEELARLAKLFPNHKRIVTMPDCESMYYYRMLAKQFATESLVQTMRYAYAYSQFKRMDRNFFSGNVKYHFVGSADVDFYKEINPDADAVFLRHPLYEVNADKKIKFHCPKIKLLFAGQYNLLCQNGSDAILEAMEKSPHLKEKYEIKFLGKGWEEWSRRFTDAGWVCSHTVFAPVYIDELQQHDIQINAIDIGTGTKGKVLDAISNGLLEIGTPVALENIAVKSREGCIVYHSVSEAIETLNDIPENIAKYEAMAECGRKNVLQAHSRKTIAKQFFNL